MNSISDAKVPPAKKAKKDEKAKTTEPKKSKDKKEKKEKAAPTVLELKNKKLVYKTKPISLEAQVVALQRRFPVYLASLCLIDEGVVYRTIGAHAVLE